MTKIRKVTTPPGSSKLALLPGGRISSNSLPTWLYAPPESPPLSLMRRRVRARGSLFRCRLYHPTHLPSIYKPRPLLLPPNPYKSGFQAFLCLSALCFRFSSLFFKALPLQQPSLTFKDPVDPIGNRALLFQLVFFTSMAAKGSSSTPPRVILISHEYKEYLHLTQTAKSTSISSVVQTGNVYNASACLSHLSGSWILDFEASDHNFGNKDLFSSPTITSPLPMITLANGSPTIAKVIGSVSPLPSIPLTSVIYISDSPFNLISTCKLTRNLNCLITIYDNSITLQDRNTRRTISIGREFQGLFHLSSPSSFTACTSMDTPLLSHSRLPNISKF